MSDLFLGIDTSNYRTSAAIVDEKGEILFKPVLNENDAFLPALTPVQNNFYRWKDFLSYTDKIISEHPDK